MEVHSGLAYPYQNGTIVEHDWSMTDFSCPVSPGSAEVVILAGGASRRMGSPKALLQFSLTPSGSSTMPESFLDHLLAVYRAAGVECATVVWPEFAGREPEVLRSIERLKVTKPQVRHVFHSDPSADRLASVMLGLRSVLNSSRVFLQDVDRPFVTTTAIRSLLMYETVTDGGYAAPNVFGHAGHPLLLTRRAVESLLEEASKLTIGDPFVPQTTLRDLLQALQGTLVPLGSMEEAFFHAININTPAEYRQFFRPEAEGISPVMVANSLQAERLPTVPR